MRYQISTLTTDAMVMSAFHPKLPLAILREQPKQLASASPRFDRLPRPSSVNKGAIVITAWRSGSVGSSV